MKRIKSFLPVICFSLLLVSLASCSNDKPVDSGHPDSLPDTITSQDTNDSMKLKFQRLVSAMPVPFDMLKQFSGAHLMFKGDILNDPKNASSYNSADQMSFNLGIYGADLAYMISQDKLGESAPYLKSIRRLSDAVVIPSAFDSEMLQRFDSNQNKKDSLQKLVHYSYQRIDSTLQGNDRLILATLVITGGWLEGIYITTQHIGTDKQNEKNKVLFDMLSEQQPYITNITELLGSFPEDSTCKNLHSDFEGLKKLFPKGADIPADQFSLQLTDLRVRIAEIRNKMVSIQ
jgi:hypothetical protein